MIGQLFHWLFHVHKWKILKEGRFDVMSDKEVVENTMVYYLQCESCGKVRRDVLTKFL